MARKLNPPPSKEPIDSTIWIRWFSTLYDTVREVTFISNNFTATVNPSITDDINAGYSVGSRWINTVGNTAFTCANNSQGAAVWV